MRSLCLLVSYSPRFLRRGFLGAFFGHSLLNRKIIDRLYSDDLFLSCLGWPETDNPAGVQRNHELTQFPAVADLVIGAPGDGQ